METDREILTEIRRLQLAEVDRLEALTDRVEALSDVVSEVVALMQEPQSTDLVDAPKSIAAAMEALDQRVTAAPWMVADEIERRRKA